MKACRTGHGRMRNHHPVPAVASFDRQAAFAVDRVGRGLATVNGNRSFQHEYSGAEQDHGMVP